MFYFLLLIYLFNAVLLIVHEIDSAYWKEWELFKLRMGREGFLLIHIPLVAFVLYGLVMLVQENRWGLMFSLLLSLAGILAFIIHLSFINKGRTEFKTPVSLGILSTIFGLSTVQLLLTIVLFFQKQI